MAASTWLSLGGALVRGGGSFGDIEVAEPPWSVGPVVSWPPRPRPEGPVVSLPLESATCMWSLLDFTTGWAGARVLGSDKSLLLSGGALVRGRTAASLFCIAFVLPSGGAVWG